MAARRTNRLIVPAVLAAVAGTALSLRAQEPPPPAATPAAAPATIRFTFKDTPFDQVLDFMARQTGLPLIREAEVPKSPVTFISDEAYSLEQALDILNRLLWMHGVQVRRQDTFLLLSKVEDMRALGAVVGADIPPGIGATDVITVVVPLNNAAAAPLAEQIKPLVSKFGGVTPLPQQNALILVDTASQCRRLRAVIEQIDSEPPSDARYQLFPLHHARADAVLSALKGLVAEKRQLVIVDKDGQMKTVTDEKVEGLNIQADPRTNSIIAVGSDSRLKTVEQLVKLLDQPGADGAAGAAGGVPGERDLVTFALSAASPDDVAAALGRLFAQLPKEKQPAVVAIPGLGKVSIVGAPEHLAQAAALIGEMDPAAAMAVSSSDMGPHRPAPALAEARTTTVPLKHATAAAVQSVITKLLTPRQAAVLRVAPAPDDRGLVVAGPAAEVDALENLVAAVDLPARSDVEVRQVRVGAADPKDVADRTQALYRQTTRGQTDPVAVTVDEDSRTLSLAGPRAALAAFTDLLKTVEANTTVERELRRFDLGAARPSLAAPRLQRLVRATLAPADGSPWAEPLIEPADELETLIVRARPEEFDAIERLVKAVDRPTAHDATFRVIPLPPLPDDADAVRERALAAYTEQAALTPDAGSLDVSADPSGRSLWVVGGADAVARFARVVDELSRAANRPTVRVLPLRHSDAATMAQALTAALAPGALPSGGRVAVTPAADANAVVLTGAESDLAFVEPLVASLDVEGVAPDKPSVATLPLTHARAEALAPVLQSLLARDPAPGRRVAPAVPVRVAAERRLNALVITGPAETIEFARQIIADLDAEPPAGASDRLVRVIPLDTADAAEAAGSIAALFQDDQAAPQPPVVRVDRPSNSLVVRATPAQMTTVEQVVRELDKASLGTAPGREMRLISVDRSRADARSVAETLQKLLEQRGGGGGGGGGGRVRIINADELLLPGSEAPAPGDKPGSLDTSRVAPAQHAVTHPLAAVVASLFAALDAPSEAPADADITIAVDAATNSLIISAPPRTAARIASLAAELQRQLPAQPGRVRVVRLPESSDAAPVAALINATLAQIGQASDQNPGGFTGRVSVQPDPDGGALIVSANDADFATIGELIAAVARPDAGPALTVKVYPLANTTAQRLQRAVLDLVGQSPRGRQAQRVLELSLGDGAPPARLEPGSVRVAADPSGASLIVAAPAAAIPVLDRFIALLDQSPVTDALATRRYALKHADPADASRLLSTSLEAARQSPGAQESPRASVVADARTGALLVTATDAQQRRAETLLASIDLPAPTDGTQVALIPLQIARPSTVRQIVEAVLAGGAGDTAAQGRLQITASDESNIFLIRATPEQLAEARRVIAEVDKAETSGLPIRSVKLERADADAVAQGLNRFFDDRARIAAKPGLRAPQRQVAAVGDRRTGTLVVSASDADFEQIRSLIATFDAPTAARSVAFRIIPLANARVADVRDLVTAMVDQTRTPNQAGDGAPADPGLAVQFDERSDSVIVSGNEASFDAAERIVKALDVPRAAGTGVELRAFRLKNANPYAVGQAIEAAMDPEGSVSRSRYSWWGSQRASTPSPSAVRVETDWTGRTIFLIGRKDRVEEALAYAQQLDAAAAAGDQQVESIAIRFARADRIAQSLQRFFADRDRAAGRDGGGWGGAQQGGVSILGSPEGNVLIVSATKDDLDLVKSFVSQMDVPDDAEIAGAPGPDGAPGAGAGRTRELYRLQNGDAGEIAAIIREQFPRSQQSREGLVIVTPQPGTNSLILAAPKDLFDRIDALIAQLDAPPTKDDVRIATVTLKSARPDDVAAALSKALPQTIKVRVTPVQRTNSLLITGSDEAIALAMEQIAALDAEPTRALGEFRRLPLKNADAFDVASTLRTLLRARPTGPNETTPAISSIGRDNTLLISAAPDQMAEIGRMVEQLDQPFAEKRLTEFVPLRFADPRATADALEVFYGRYAAEAATPAARSVTIIANPVSKSLVVSAAESEWPGIRALLEKLDNETYDTSRRLEIVPLEHADAASLARTLTEAFVAPLRAELERERAARRQQRPQGPGQWGGTGPDFFDVPTVLVDSKDSVVVTAEPLTNALVIAGTREQAQRIKDLVAGLDVPEFARLPEARLIPLRIGPASAIAQTLRQTFTETSARNGAGGGGASLRSVMIVGEDRSNTLIVRADDAQFAQVKAMADSLQQEGDRSRAQVRVIRVANVAAGRLVASVRAAFAPVVQEGGETLAVEVDRTANALVVASSEQVFSQIKTLVEELDKPVPGRDGAAPGDGGGVVAAGLAQDVTIVDLQNHAPDEMRRVLEQIGVNKPQPQDRFGGGVVSEPVTIVPLTSRRAIAVVAGPHDALAVAALVKSLDAAPALADQHVLFVRLKNSRAEAVAPALEGMLKPKAQDSQSEIAAALAEGVRRLSIHRAEADKPNPQVDLGKPITILAEPQTNAIILASTEPNVAALAQLVEMLDKLPLGDAVVVRFFPLKNAAAVRIGAVVRELFAQGDRLRTDPGTTVRSEPTTEVGKALIGQVAVSVDDRTNSLVVAGREEAVALVELMIKQLDSESTANWIEPTLVKLEHADATRLADTLRQVLVQGAADTPEAQALQKQIGRYRVAALSADSPAARNGAKPPPGAIEADRFAPLSSLVIIPEHSLNALIVVGSKANTAAVAELARLLDVPAAAAANSVRLFPLQVAAADRVAGILRDVFRGQVQSGAIQPADDLVISADPRTNAVVVSTSPRSFTVVESLIEQLDAATGGPTVGLTIIPIPEGGGDVAVLAPKIERLLRERLDSARRAGSVASPSDTISIQPDPATRSLIVAASQENVEIIRSLVETLSASGQALTGSQVVEVIPVASARVGELADAIADLYVEKENRLRGQDAVRVSSDARLNALIVRGSAADVEAVRALANRLDATPVAAVTEIKRIELTKADAADVVKLLQNVLAGRPIAGGAAVGQRKAQLLRFVREQTASDIAGAEDRLAQPTEAEISGAIQEQATLTAELRTNSIVVVAPSRLMVLIEALVADLDQTTAGGRTIEIFRLTNADARAMAEVLRDLFNLRQQGSTLVLVPGRIDDGSEELSANTAAAAPAAGEIAGLYPTLDERQQLAITIDARTNSLLVSGTPEYLDKVRQVVQQLDGVEANEREQVVYELRNAKAADVATTLREYFQEQGDKARQLLGPERSGSLLQLLEKEITVQGDTPSNRLIVGVSPSYRDMVTRLVQELDSTPPQVMIQVLLAEVTIDSEQTWGIDARVGPFGGEAYNAQYLGAGAGVTTALGVPNLSVSSTDFELLVRALESQGRLEVLSRPQILVNNNSKARIQVGENIALPTDVERLDNGNTVAAVEREDVGIILNVTPTISADGFVRMDILPEISSLSARTTQISEDFAAPVITRRQVETNVTVRDGETIVIGGLIQTTDEERKTKVPLIGDVPLVGEFFKTSKFTHQKTELLVILTPRVIHSGDEEGSQQMRILSETEINRLTRPERLDHLLTDPSIPVDSAPEPRADEHRSPVLAPEREGEPR